MLPFLFYAPIKTSHCRTWIRTIVISTHSLYLAIFCFKQPDEQVEHEAYEWSSGGLWRVDIRELIIICVGEVDGIIAWMITKSIAFRRKLFCNIWKMLTNECNILFGLEKMVNHVRCVLVAGKGMCRLLWRWLSCVFGRCVLWRSIEYSVSIFVGEEAAWSISLPACVH